MAVCIRLWEQDLINAVVSPLAQHVNMLLALNAHGTHKVLD